MTNQLATLLAEIQAILTVDQYDELAQRMGLSILELTELFES